MSSSVGPRAKGTDGSDYRHRERVATHYKKSAELKAKLKRIFLLQILCALTCFAVGLVTRYDYSCLLSFSGYLCGLPLGYLALKSNRISYINLYGCCCSILGVFPMIYLLYISLWTGMVDRFRYLRLVVAVSVVSVNTMGMFYAKNLMNTWSIKR